MQILDAVCIRQLIAIPEKGGCCLHLHIPAPATHLRQFIILLRQQFFVQWISVGKRTIVLLFSEVPIIQRFFCTLFVVLFRNRHKMFYRIAPPIVMSTAGSKNYFYGQVGMVFQQLFDLRVSYCAGAAVRITYFYQGMGCAFVAQINAKIFCRRRQSLLPFQKHIKYLCIELDTQICMFGCNGLLQAETIRLYAIP